MLQKKWMFIQMRFCKNGGATNFTQYPKAPEGCKIIQMNEQ